MDHARMLKTFCDAVERRDGKAFALLFADDGVYHDVFYGAFKGRADIAELIEDWFYRTARDFRWDMHDPVSDGRMLYARYTFSYVSTLPEARDKRVGFEGVAIMRLTDGLIAEYREVANVGPAFVALNFAPERVCKILAKEGEALRADPTMARHLA
jgi:ketosteroid isomerase-like protein